MSVRPPVNRCTHMNAHVCSGQVDIGHLFPLCQDFLLNLGSTLLVNLASQLTLGDPLSPPPRFWDCRQASHTCLVFRVLGIQTLIQTLEQQGLYALS